MMSQIEIIGKICQCFPEGYVISKYLMTNLIKVVDSIIATNKPNAQPKGEKNEND